MASTTSGSARGSDGRDSDQDKRKEDEELDRAVGRDEVPNMLPHILGYQHHLSYPKGSDGTIKMTKLHLYLSDHYGVIGKVSICWLYCQGFNPQARPLMVTLISF